MGFLFFPIWVWGSAWRPLGPPELRYNIHIIVLPTYDGVEEDLCNNHEVNRNFLALHGPETIFMDHGKVDHLIGNQFAL